MVRRKGRYILVCTGHDLTPEQRNDAKTHIAQILSAQGHAGYDELIEVLGASQVTAFVERYAAIASAVTLFPIEDALTVDEWRQAAHMSNPFEPSIDQQVMIEQIRSGLLGETKHIRVLGEPGLGKSRIVLESVSLSEIAPVVLYIEHGSRFGQSKLFRHLLRVSSEKPMVLVVDELPESEMSQLWAHLKTRCGALKLVTLDHGRDESRDSEIQRFTVPRLPDETIKAIIARYVGDSLDLSRWVEICEGSPRVAQAVAENLRANPDDLLRPPSTVPLWERFLHGYGRRDELHARQIDCVTKHLALFSRFGYESPVGNEARYIAGLVEKIDPTIGWARFQEIIGSLRARRVLQGSKTLFYVPRALHIYLWKQFWESYGRGFDFAGVFASMPETLHAWFMSMFKFAGAAATSDVIYDILKADGIYAEKSALMSAKGSHFLSTLAEANAPAVLKLLEETIGRWSNEELLSFTQHRQHIVWTLEKIAVWKPFFVRAALLLSRLAVNETGSNSNNAVGTLLGLFNIGYEAAATESSPAERLPAVLQLLRSDSEADRDLALRALASALDTRGMGFRIVGPEFQGLKDRADLWKPKTYGEQWRAQLQYLETLLDETRTWPSNLRSEVCATILKAVTQQIQTPPCTDLAIRELEILVRDPAMDPSKVNRFFFDWFEFERGKNLQDQAINRRLLSIWRTYTRRSLASRFQRYVIDVDWMEWDADARVRHSKSKNRAKALVNALARRVAATPRLFAEMLSLLTPKKDSPGLYHFGGQLAANDADHQFLQPLVDLTQESKHQVCLAGYLESLRTQAHDVYVQTLRGMLGEKDHAWLGALLVIRTTYDDDLFVRCLDAFEKGWIGPAPIRPETGACRGAGR